MDAEDFDDEERGNADGAQGVVGGPGLHQPHDKLFAAAFEVSENTAALLRAELPAELAAAIDWDTLKHEPGSFVDPGFRRAHSDLLFSIGLRADPRPWSYASEACPRAWPRRCGRSRTTRSFAACTEPRFRVSVWRSSPRRCSDSASVPVRFPSSLAEAQA